MATEKIFVNSNEIRNCAQKISKYDKEIMDLLGQFESEMRRVEGYWQSEASEEMKEAFSMLRPSFDKFHNYNTKVVNHLNTNVADARDALDMALKNNASNLKRTI